MAREDLHFRLRIPEELKARIEREAERNQRSITAEIVFRLKESFGSEQSEADMLDRRIREMEAQLRGARAVSDQAQSEIHNLSRMLEEAWRAREELRNLEARRQAVGEAVRKASA